MLFIAFSFEYNRFLNSLENDSIYFETSLPIQLNATCNGYQHLALLSLDYNLAKELNLTKSSWDDKPKDFYSFMSVKLINYFRDKLNNNALNDEEREVYTRFSHLTIARKIVKKAIMTRVYNASHNTLVEYLQENFIAEEGGDPKNKLCYFVEDPSIKLKEKDFGVLVNGLQVVLVDDRFKLKKLLNYLNGVTEFITTLDLPIV